VTSCPPLHRWTHVHCLRARYSHLSHYYARRVHRKAQCNGLASVRLSFLTLIKPAAHSQRDSPGAACDAASIHFGLAVRRTDMLRHLFAPDPYRIMTGWKWCWQDREIRAAVTFFCTAHSLTSALADLHINVPLNLRSDLPISIYSTSTYLDSTEQSWYDRPRLSKSLQR